MVNLGGGYDALDFAESGVVHALGGYIALAACMLLGPRIGKYDEKGNPRSIPGHSLAFAVIGTFILWFGWFGFNSGSTLSAHELRVSVIAANTNLAAAAGAVTAMLITWARNGKPDVGMSCNGCRWACCYYSSMCMGAAMGCCGNWNRCRIHRMLRIPVA